MAPKDNNNRLGLPLDPLVLHWSVGLHTPSLSPWHTVGPGHEVQLHCSVKVFAPPLVGVPASEVDI